MGEQKPDSPCTHDHTRWEHRDNNAVLVCDHCDLSGFKLGMDLVLSGRGHLISVKANPHD